MKVLTGQKMKWVCHLCYPSAEEIGEVIPGLWLARLDGKFVLVGGQGHNGDVLFTFPPGNPKPPVVEKRRGESNKAFDRRYETLPKHVISRDLKWIENARECIKIKIRLHDVFWLAKALRSGGYRPYQNGCAEIWLYERCIDLLRKSGVLGEQR